MRPPNLQLIESPDDEFIQGVLAASPHAYFSHTPAFMRFCEAVLPGARGHLLGMVFGDAQRVYVPLLERPEARGLCNRFESMFRSYGGPIAEGTLTPERLQAVLEALVAWCAGRKMAGLVLRTSPGSPAVPPLEKSGLLLQSSTEDVSSESLRLPSTIEELVKGFAKGRKSDVKRAEKNGVTVAVATTDREFAEFSTVYDDRVRRWGDEAKARFSLDFFQKLGELSRATEGVRLWLASVDGRVHAGAVMLYHGRTAMYWIGASLEDDSKRPNAYLQFRIMEDAIARGIEIYDMGRSGRPGVKAFKQHFGATSVPYQVLTVDNLWWQGAVGVASRAWRLVKWAPAIGPVSGMASDTVIPEAEKAPPPPRGTLAKLLSLLSDSAVYGVSSLLSQVIGFLLLPLYTRYLTPIDQGVIAMVTTVTAFYAPLSRLGIINSIFRRFNLDKSPDERRRLLSTALWSVVISSVAVLAIGLAFAPMLSDLAIDSTDATGIVQVSLLASAAASIGMVPLSVLRADRRVKTTASVNVLKLLLSVSTTIWLVVFAGWGVWGVVIGSLVGEVAGMAALFGLTAASYDLRPSYAVWKRLAAYGVPFIPHQLLGLAMTLVGQYVVGHMLGLREAGLYSTATKFALPVAFVINSIQAAWVAFKFQIHAEDEDPATFFRTVTTYYVAGTLYLWVGVSLWGPEMLWLLTEQSYHPAAWLVAMTGLIPVTQGIYFMMGTGMEIGEDVRSMPLVTLAGLITALVSVWQLVPHFGAAGAAIATANAFVALSVVIYFLSQRRFAISYDWPALFALCVLAVGAVAIGYWTLDLPGPARISLAVLISLAFPLVEFAVLSRSPTERHRMRALLTRASMFLFSRRTKPVVDA